MRNFRHTLTVVPFAITMMMSQAFAGDGATASIGTRISEMLKGMTGPVIMLVSLAAMLSGVFLFIKGLVKLRDSAGQQGQVGPAVLTLVAATLLIALPNVAGIGLSSIMGKGGLVGVSEIDMANIGLDADPSAAANGFSGIFKASVSAPKDCLIGEEAVTCMAQNLANNVVPIGIIAVYALIFIAGLWTFAACLMELAKGQNWSQGRVLPDGWFGKFVFSMLLMNGSLLLAISTNTLFGNGGPVTEFGINTSHSLLQYKLGGGSAVLVKYQELVGYTFIILALFGVIAFARGIFLMKGAAQGQNGASYGAGAVFLVAGVLLANAKASTCMVLYTAGVQTMGGAAGSLGFCT